MFQCSCYWYLRRIFLVWIIAIFLILERAVLISESINIGGKFSQSNCQTEVISPLTNLTCNRLSLSHVRISWHPPVSNHVNLTYIIVGGHGNVTTTSHQTTIESCSSSSTIYNVHVHVTGCTYAEGLHNSGDVLCPPHEELTLSVLTNSNTTISLQWPSVPPHLVQSFVVLWAESVLGQSWTESLRLPSTTTSDTITDLKPDTGYEFLLKASCVAGDAIVQEIPVLAKTLISAPASPENVGFEVSDLVWNASSVGSASPILNYTIDYRSRSAPGSPHVVYGKWMVVRGVGAQRERRWLISGLEEMQWYEFRVYAFNEVGRGDVSLKTPPYYVKADDNLVSTQVLGSSLGPGISIVLVLVVVGIAYWRRRNRGRLLRDLPSLTTVQLNYGTDIELAHIRNMTSLAVAAGNRDGRVRLPLDYRQRLTLMPREKLSLDSLLGSGAFGEVYQGKALVSNIANEEVDIPVAIKTLKAHASEGEKDEFLMEAYYMSKFDHPNIISSVGVCLDNEFQFLILELMEGGDLRGYLHKAYPARQTDLCLLTLTDLLAMSIDLASACQYLEAKHFIHRDLAARNCLVSTSSYSDEGRVVKIGDFGLARDLYKNDYYLKEGDGLVPVRWMAPESIFYQRYTVKSDVWSFGVVLWELSTFGQRPFAVYTNQEVMVRVRHGERLAKADDQHCPASLYGLMLRCWEEDPNNRPDFQQIYDDLLRIKADLCATPIHAGCPPTDTISYATVQSLHGSVFSSEAGYDNETFQLDEASFDRSSSDISSLSSTGSCTAPYLARYQEAEDTTTPKTIAGNVNYTTLGFRNSDERASVASDTTVPMKVHSSRLASKISNDYVASPSALKRTESFGFETSTHEYVEAEVMTLYLA